MDRNVGNYWQIIRGKKLVRINEIRFKGEAIC